MIGFLHGRLRQAAFIFALAIFAAGTANAQYLHTQGKQIVDKDGKEVILRGMGLGGWMLQEGYMLETNSFANPQHQIRAKIQELIGEANTNQFYEAWLANHCTERCAYRCTIICLHCLLKKNQLPDKTPGSIKDL